MVSEHFRAFQRISEDFRGFQKISEHFMSNAPNGVHAQTQLSGEGQSMFLGGRVRSPEPRAFVLRRACTSTHRGPMFTSACSREKGQKKCIFQILQTGFTVFLEVV